MAYSFGTQGALPPFTSQYSSASNPLNQGTLALSGTTPQAKALNTASNGLGQSKPNIPATNPSANSFNLNGQSSPNIPPTAGLLHQTPTTPVKSQTTNNVDGSSQTTTYHVPDSTTVDSSTSKNTATQGTGSSNPTVVEDGTINSQTPNQSPSAFAGYLGGAASGASAAASTGLTQEQEAYQKAQQENDALNQSIKNEAGTLANMQGNPIPIEFQQGRGNIVQGIYENQQAKLASQLQNETNLAGVGNTSQGQGITGLNTAASTAAPNQVPYSNQFIDPTTGQPIGGGQAGQLPAATQSFVNSLSQEVQSGAMTRADAESRLSSYGPAGLQALNTALGPNFNTNASNASAGTTAVGQQIQTAADSTNKALDTLSSSFSSLSGLQTGGIPLTNSIAQWIGSNLGDASLTQYKTNLADARSQLIGVLNSSGGTPTGNEETANQYLPDNMTPQQFQQNVGTAQNPGIVRQLVAQKVSSFTGSGLQQNSSGSSDGTPMFGSFN